MPRVIYQSSMSEFLLMTEKRSLGKAILDCVEVGSGPPFALFAKGGYKRYGIDVSKDAIKHDKLQRFRVLESLVLL